MGTKLFKRDQRTGKHYSVPLVSLRHDTAPVVAIAPGLDVITWSTPMPVPASEDESLWISDAEWARIEEKLSNTWLNQSTKTTEVEVEEVDESWTAN